MTPTPYTIGWHVGDRPRWRLALKDGERVIAAELKSMRIPSPQASEKNG